MNPLELTTYYRFFEVYMQSGPLPDDEHMLRGISKLDSLITPIKALMGVVPDGKAWQEFVDATIGSILNKHFKVQEDGNWHNPDWDKLILESKTRHKTAVDKATHAAAARWGSHEEESSVEVPEDFDAFSIA